MPIALMLATLTNRREFGDDWLLERKFDGERCVARRDGGDVRLESRTARDLTGTYPEVRAAVAAQRARDVLLDGEVVAYDVEDGPPAAPAPYVLHRRVVQLAPLLGELHPVDTSDVLGRCELGEVAAHARVPVDDRAEDVEDARADHVVAPDRWMLRASVPR
jgi:ATP dependent DNA ligase domain